MHRHTQSLIDKRYLGLLSPANTERRYKVERTNKHAHAKSSVRMRACIQQACKSKLGHANPHKATLMHLRRRTNKESQKGVALTDALRLPSSPHQGSSPSPHLPSTLVHSHPHYPTVRFPLPQPMWKEIQPACDAHTHILSAATHLPCTQSSEFRIVFPTAWP